MKTIKCYTWLESCGSPLSDGIKNFFLILQSVRFSMTVRTDIFLYTEKLSVTPFLVQINCLYWNQKHLLYFGVCTKSSIWDNFTIWMKDDSESKSCSRQREKPALVAADRFFRVLGLTMADKYLDTFVSEFFNNCHLSWQISVSEFLLLSPWLTDIWTHLFQSSFHCHHGKERGSGKVNSWQGGGGDQSAK